MAFGFIQTGASLPIKIDSLTLRVKVVIKRKLVFQGLVGWIFARMVPLISSTKAMTTNSQVLTRSNTKRE